MDGLSLSLMAVLDLDNTSGLLSMLDTNLQFVHSKVVITSCSQTTVTIEVHLPALPSTLVILSRMASYVVPPVPAASSTTLQDPIPVHH